MSEEKKDLSVTITIPADLVKMDPISREAINLIVSHPMMAILRKDGKPGLPVGTPEETIAACRNVDELSLRDRVGIMLLCGSAIRLIGRDVTTLEGAYKFQELGAMYAIVGASTGLKVPVKSVFEMYEQLSMLN